MELDSLLFLDLIISKKTHFEISRSIGVQLATASFILLALLFPVLGYLTGYPCPLAGFTLALLAASPKTDRDIYFLTLIWAFVNIPKCFEYMNCYEEATLVATGVYALGMLKYRETPRTENAQ